MIHGEDNVLPDGCHDHVRGVLVRLALVAATADLLNKGLAGSVTDHSTAVPRSTANPSTPAPGSLLKSVGIALVRTHPACKPSVPCHTPAGRGGAQRYRI